MGVIWLDASRLFHTAIRRLEQAEIVLDIGCGVQPQKHILPKVHICCEPFSQYVKVLQEKIHDEKDRSYVVINSTWSDAVTLFPAKSVDTVFLNDVIEHLEKDEALALLAATERIARRQIAVFTPLGFMPQQHPDGKDAAEGWMVVPGKNINRVGNRKILMPVGKFMHLRCFTRLIAWE